MQPSTLDMFLYVRKTDAPTLCRTQVVYDCALGTTLGGLLRTAAIRPARSIRFPAGDLSPPPSRLGGRKERTPTGGNRSPPCLILTQRGDYCYTQGFRRGFRDYGPRMSCGGNELVTVSLQ